MKSEIQSMSNKLWNKNYIFMLFANLFIYLSFFMLAPTLPAYAKIIGGSNFEASLVVSTFSITSLLVRLLAGNLMDKIEIKPLIIIGAIILAITTLSYIWIPIIGIVLVRIIQGIGWGLSTTGVAAIFSNIVPKEKRGEGMGYYSLSMIVSMALSPMLAIILMNLYSFKIIAIISIILVVIGIIFLNSVKIPKKEKAKSTEKFSLSQAFEARAALPSVLCFLIVITLCGIMSYIMLYGKEIKIDSIWTYFIGFVAMILVTRPFVGKIFDKKGHAVIIIPGIISLIIGLITLSYATSTLTLIISSLFYGLGYGAVQPSLQAWAVNRSPANRQGAANGTFLSFMDFSYTVGSIILSSIAGYRSYAVMYRYSTVFIIIALIIYVYHIFKNGFNK